MNHYHFDQEMTRLAGAFDREYSEAQQGIIFNKTKTWTDETFTKVIDHLIQTLNHKPAISSFFKALTGLRESGEFKAERSHADAHCSRCGGAGMLRAYYMTKGDSFSEPVERYGVALCDCRNASNWSQKILRVDEVGDLVREERVSIAPNIPLKSPEPQKSRAPF